MTLRYSLLLKEISASCRCFMDMVPSIRTYEKLTRSSAASTMSRVLVQNEKTILHNNILLASFYGPRQATTFYLMLVTVSSPAAKPSF